MNELMCHSRATSVQDSGADCEGLREEAGTLGDDPGGEVAGVGAPVGGIRGLEGGQREVRGPTRACGAGGCTHAHRGLHSRPRLHTLTPTHSCTHTHVRTHTSRHVLTDY